MTENERKELLTVVVNTYSQLSPEKQEKMRKWLKDNAQPDIQHNGTGFNR